MTMDGAERMSRGVRILGFFVGYMGYNAHKRTTNDERRDYAIFGLDIKNMLPCFMTTKCV